MTQKIRLRLVYKYTAIIAVMLLCFAIGGFVMCRYAVQKVITDAMYDSLNTEIREAEKSGLTAASPLRETAVKSDIGSMYNYAYWFVGDRLVFAEHPSDKKVDVTSRRKMLKYAVDGKLKHFSLHDEQGRRWQFYVLSGKTANGRVIILINTTPFKLLSLQYIYVLIATLFFMLLIAWIGGNILADRILAPFIAVLEEQKRFVADASHELRTPLAVMLSSLELLEMKHLEPALVSGMKEEVLGMSDLIRDLLELARADNRQLDIYPESFELRPLIDNILDGLAGRKNIRLFNLTAGPAELRADKEMIRRLLFILFDNAIKYSPENTKITVAAVREERQVVIKVQDQGIGIEKKDLKNIFERFYRADKARSRKIPGTGLGLPIALDIARRHGGGIDVESVPGKGTLFTVQICDQ